MHWDTFSLSIPSATNMAVSVLRVTIVLGLLALIPTCHAGKCFWSQLGQCAVVTLDQKKLAGGTDTEPEGQRGGGTFGHWPRQIFQSPEADIPAQKM